jgi:O-antigen ligase
MGVLAFGVLSFGAVEPWSIAAFQAGSFLLVVWWVLAAMHRGVLRVQWPLVLTTASAFLALIAFQILARVTTYRFGSENAFYGFLTCGVLMFLGAQVLSSENDFQRFGLATSGFGLAVAVLAIAQALTSPTEIYWTIYPRFGDGVFGPYVNHSHYAGLMEMLIPFPFVLGRGRTLARHHRGLAFTASAIMVASVFMSGSRGGIIAVLVELCLLYFLVFRSTQEESAGGRKSRFVAALALAGATGLIFFLGGQEMVARISSLRDPYGASVGATRIAITKDCVAMFLRRPVWGWGGGTFAEVYPAFRSFSTNLIVNAAHNDYLQLLVEYGLVGFGISICFLAVAYRRIRILRRNWKDSWPHAVSFAALLGTIGILVHSLTDFNLQVPANAALFYVMCTVASLRPSEPTENTVEPSSANLLRSAI